MAFPAEIKPHIEEVADDTLSRFEAIADAARRGLRNGSSLRADSLASINTLTSGAAVRNLDQISHESRESCEKLADEPAIARVTVVDDQGQERTYYICRTSPVMGVPNLASYRAPVGRLASLGIGEEFKLPNGTTVEVLERARLRPVKRPDGWDSRDTVIEGEQYGPLTIESLRALLTETAREEVTEDLLGQLLAEEAASANVIEGIRRTVITKMGLRDQPVLDRYQDEIFRLPLDGRLLILGPPGSGKTTTLIRRLGQKIDSEFLEEHEQRLVEVLQSVHDTPHSSSWLMFTPTELLKQYLKEAFAREGVPAPDQRIVTWQDYRRELARNEFNVLRTATGGGTFVLKDGLTSLGTDALDQPIKWFEDFQRWQEEVFALDLLEASTSLKSNELSAAVGSRVDQIVGKILDAGLATTFGLLAAEVPNVQALVNSLKDATDGKIKGALNLQLNRNRTFLDELARYLDGLQQAPSQEADDADDPDAEDDEEAAPRTGRAAAVNAYIQAVRAQARAASSKRAVSRTSRNGKIIEWLADRGLADADRAGVGASLLVQTQARRFINPVKRYLDGIPKRYRAYRRENQQKGRWYRADGFEARDIHPLELDVVLLSILRAAADLISKPSVQRDINEPAWSALRPIVGQYRNQILVDEATDFSPIQLGCMAALTHPRLRSFFACGDFNQRLTTWGARSSDELKWVFSDFEIREISVSYRQSKQLNELARAIIRAVGGTEQTVSLPAHVDNDGIAPVLMEHTTEAAVVPWLAERIREIERFVGQLPSTAIFVNAEDQVGPLADALKAALAEHNIQVVACREGQAVGQESSVRVFDIQHIKGLEFEAVFFVGVDQLAAMHPTLFDKYLYVGTTRAATYLGVTCNQTLPPVMEVLRPLFGQHWQVP